MSTEYIIVKDTNFELGVNDDKEFSFNLPWNIVRSGNRRPIISFQIKPSSQLPVKFSVDINDHPQIDNIELSSNDRHLYWEAINENETKSGSNTVQFRFISGQGSLRVSDVIVWFNT